MLHDVWMEALQRVSYFDTVPPVPLGVSTDELTRSVVSALELMPAAECDVILLHDVAAFARGLRRSRHYLLGSTVTASPSPVQACRRARDWYSFGKRV
jgi:hypothetical protein